MMAIASVVAAPSARAGVPPPGFPFDDPTLQVQQLVEGLEEPTAMAFLGPGDLLVLQKRDGKVKRVLNGVLQPGDVLDVAVVSDGNRGLLGIAVHPQFPAVPFVYLTYTESSTGSDATSGQPLGHRLYRYEWNGEALVNPTLLLNLPAASNQHAGGTLAFGLDGTLYLVIGDQQRNGQLQNIPGGPPPDDTSVIIRIRDDGTVPDDNPFINQGGRVAAYYAYGIRNSFGLAVDPVTGALWDTENGPESYDEINRVAPGLNSGWKQLMGPDARDPQGEGDLFALPGSRYSDPAFSWLEPTAPTALAFLHSTQLGEPYLDQLLVADFIYGAVYRFALNDTRDALVLDQPEVEDLVADTESERGAVVFGQGFDGLTDLKVGPDGLLYMLSFLTGKVLVVLPAPDYTVAADLSLAQEASDQIVEVGQPLTYTMTVTNHGPHDATHATLTDPLPEALALVSATASQGNCEGSDLLVCALGAVPAGASAVVTMVVTPTTAGAVANRSEVLGPETDLNTANNNDTTVVTVEPTDFRLGIAKSGNGSGTVTSDPAGITCGSDCSQRYLQGTTVSLTATPATGSVFEGWSGPVDCEDGQVTLEADVTCAAAFIGPDLIVSSLSAPSASGAGATITVTDTTKNQGLFLAGASGTSLYFSTDKTLDNGDAWLGVRGVPTLDPATTNSGPTTVTIPADAATGTAYLFANADADGDVDETKESNNLKSKSIKIGPDLKVSSLSAPSTAEAGATITISDTTKNDGGGGSGASRTAFYLSSDGSWDAADVVLGGRDVPELAAGAKHKASTVAVIPADTAAGTYALIGKADDDGAVVEVSESNNTKSRTITVN